MLNTFLDILEERDGTDIDPPSKFKILLTVKIKYHEGNMEVQKWRRFFSREGGFPELNFEGWEGFRN